jgi:SAM-dependent methyltransferase
LPEHTRGDAYRLATPADHAAFYDAWAPTYELDFAQASAYTYPEQVAEIFLARATPSDAPVADIGCGTGLLGAAISVSGLPIDGFDISAGMQDVAREKGAYRDLIVTDLKVLATSGAYGAIVSSGTFTFGHLSAQALPRILGLGRGGALCVIGVNALHFEDGHFEDVLHDLVVTGRIDAPERHDILAYATADPADPLNRATVLAFRLSR